MIIKGIQVNNQAVPYTGVIKEINDTGVTIQITGRLGVMKLPWRQLISNERPKVGDEVKFTMSLIELKNDNYL